MFEASTVLFLYVETPLHAGTGRGIGAVDLPIQRERITGYPLVQATGVKGKLRDAVGASLGSEKLDDEKKSAILRTVFGDSDEGGSRFAGALSPGDARLLLLPVRSLEGVFAWVTSPDVLARFQRDCRGTAPTFPLPPKLDEDSALVPAKCSVEAGGEIVLEEFSFQACEHKSVAKWADWLSRNALPVGDEFEYWREKLKSSLVVLPENAFRDFCMHATEVVTRVRLEDDTKTVKAGALWTEENLPSESLLYTPLHASRARSYENGSGKLAAVEPKWYESDGASLILKYVANREITRLQIGGNETVGRGVVSLRFHSLNGGSDQ